MELILEELTFKVINAYYKVYNTLGYGFLEKVYENALAVEFQQLGLFYKKQFQIKVYYEEKEVGFYIADFLIEEKLIIEIKAMESLCEEHEYQLINYLKATNIEIGLLMNFGKKAEFKRKIFQNKLKKSAKIPLNPAKSAFP